MENYYGGVLALASVCLGALITGLISILLHRLNKEKDLELSKRDEIKKYVDDILISAVEYFKSCDALLAAIDGVARDVDKKGKPYPDYKNFLNEHDRAYLIGKSNLQLCEAKLIMLMGVQSSASYHLMRYYRLFSDFRMGVFFNDGDEYLIPSISASIAKQDELIAEKNLFVSTIGEYLKLHA